MIHALASAFDRSLRLLRCLRALSRSLFLSFRSFGRSFEAGLDAVDRVCARERERGSERGREREKVSSIGERKRELLDIGEKKAANSGGLAFIQSSPTAREAAAAAGEPEFLLWGRRD